MQVFVQVCVVARYCLDYLTKRDVLEIESVQDTSDNKEYAVYCKREYIVRERPLLINAVCSKVDEIRGLADIDKILEERQQHKPQQ
jgi:hypothetical protein